MCLNIQANDASTAQEVLECTDNYTKLRMYLNTWATDASTTLEQTEVLECIENYTNFRMYFNTWANDASTMLEVGMH